MSRNLYAGRKHSRQFRRAMFLEKLSDRCLFAGDVTFSVNATNYLTVNGSDFDDVISIYDDGVSVKIAASYNGNDVVLDTARTLASLAGVRAFGGLGADEITIDATMGTITSFLYGQQGADKLFGGAGKDTLQGNQGADELHGGGNDDALQFDEFDTVLDGGSGLDTGTATGAVSGLSLVVSDAWSTERLFGTDFVDNIDASAVTFRMFIYGKGGSDVLTGGSADDVLTGDAGDDILIGGLGNDQLVGGAGNNTLTGGVGANILQYEAAPAGVIVNLQTGIVSNGYGGTDTVSGIVTIRGSQFDDTLRGSNAPDEQLYGLGGNDTLIGLGGSDRLDGGAGIDTVDYSESPAAVIVDLGNNLNELGGDAAGDILVLPEIVRGSSFNDTLNGNGSSNTFYGGGGDDLLQGRGGDDSLFGEAGADRLYGDGGTDNVDGGADSDYIFADSLDDQATIFTGGTGTDFLKAAQDALSVQWILTNASLFEIITATSGADTIDGSLVTNTALQISTQAGADTIWGGSQADTINGDGGADIIYGGLGADVLRGGSGGDSLYANDLANTNDNAQDRLFGQEDFDFGFGFFGPGVNNDLKYDVEA